MRNSRYSNIRAEELADELGESAAAFTVDVAEEIQVEEAVKFAVSKFGSLDIMFNNAGILGSVGPISEIDGDGWLRTIDVLEQCFLWDQTCSKSDDSARFTDQLLTLLRQPECEPVWPACM